MALNAVATYLLSVQDTSHCEVFFVLSHFLLSNSYYDGGQVCGVRVEGCYSVAENSTLLLLLLTTAGIFGKIK